MRNQYTPTNARKNFFGIIKDVAENRSVIEIVPSSGDGGVAMVPLADWSSIKETLFLEQSGTLKKARERRADDSGFTDIDDLDWDNI